MCIRDRLTIGTADSGGSMYPAGSVLADVIRESAPDVRVNISASTGSYQNICLLYTSRCV